MPAKCTHIRTAVRSRRKKCGCTCGPALPCRQRGSHRWCDRVTLCTYRRKRDGRGRLWTKSGGLPSTLPPPPSSCRVSRPAAQRSTKNLENSTEREARWCARSAERRGRVGLPSAARPCTYALTDSTTARYTYRRRSSSVRAVLTTLCSPFHFPHTSKRSSVHLPTCQVISAV